MPRSFAKSSPIAALYIERLHEHLSLTSIVREYLLELLSRPAAPPTLQHWITTILEQNKEQERQISHRLRQHGEKPRNESDTLSGLLDTVVTCFPTGEQATHLLGVMLDIAGYLARLRTSLALLLLLAESSPWPRMRPSSHNSAITARTLPAASKRFCLPFWMNHKEKARPKRRAFLRIIRP
ncbi:hypothetical protein GM556_07935 [Bombella sp. ESL0378]|uniref:hypothetical protein n=1 Tax=Bombella sp. ESL0378 TaxID=2676442 RepID=UPI0012D97C93|nr:hypothetical protein [Bombella sp. ESL0378]MUG05463.1 hypothetical protein [Bombella sp. ESL0378]